MSTQKKFRAVLERDNTPLQWVIAKLPFDPAKAWPTRNRMRVKGTINGFAFRTSLFGSAKGGHVLLVNKKMQAGASAALGSTVKIELEPDFDERPLTIPPELDKLLKQDRALRAWFEKLSTSRHKYLADRINACKGTAARLRCAERQVEILMLAMEGERELPPILQVAFRRQPQALAGWQAMTPAQRRGHLLGIFYYQSPESRQKRANQAVAEALKAVERGHPNGESLLD